MDHAPTSVVYIDDHDALPEGSLLIGAYSHPWMADRHISEESNGRFAVIQDDRLRMTKVWRLP